MKSLFLANWIWLDQKSEKLAPFFNSIDTLTKHTIKSNLLAIEYIISIIYDTILCIPNQDTQLCNYALPKESGFEKWHITTLKQLREEFPKDQNTPKISRYFFTKNNQSNTKIIETNNLKNRYLPLVDKDMA